MITIFRKKTCCLVGIILALILMLPFSAQSEEKDVKAVKRLAIVSFKSLLPEKCSTMIVCPLCSGGYSGGKIEKGAEKIIEESFVDKLRDMNQMQVLPVEKVSAVYNRVVAEKLKKPLIEVLKDVGAELQADVIAVGYVYRFTERVGYDLSAERPASVAFDIHLLNVKDGSTVWRGVFDKTQKSLMEDLFQTSSFIKGGAKWLTASQLAKLGIDKIFETFPGVEQQQQQ